VKLEDLLGHEAPAALLGRMLESGRLPHALLFQGPEGVGKSTAAEILAKAVLCEREPPTDRPCDDCAACRKIAHGNHPDVLLVERLPKKAASREIADDDGDEDDGEDDTSRSADLRPFIVVPQIRDLATHAAYAPREGRFRIFTINPADRMNHHAQNALLKTLEEPPGRAILILVASRPHLLLPTVRSRCLAVRFAPMAASDLAARLEARGLGREESLTRAALAAGRQGRALTLDPDGLSRRREEILETLLGLAAGPRAIADLASSAAMIAGAHEESLLEGLDLMETLLRDAAVAHAAGTGAMLVHPDLGPRLLSLGISLGSTRASGLVRSIERLRGELRFNLNRTLVTESLLAAVAGGPLP